MDFTCQQLPQAQELYPSHGMNPRSASEFFNICNDKVLFGTKYKVVLSILLLVMIQ